MTALKFVMRLNAASCLLFGVLFIYMPNHVAIFLGGEAPPPGLLIAATGVVLFMNGLHLIWSSTLSQINKGLIYYFSFGDFSWVLISIYLMTTRLWVTTTAGIMTATGVATVVGCFGIMQFKLSRASAKNLKP